MIVPYNNITLFDGSVDIMGLESTKTAAITQNHNEDIMNTVGIDIVVGEIVIKKSLSINNVNEDIGELSDTLNNPISCFKVVYTFT